MKVIVSSKHSDILKGGEKRMRHLRIFLAFGMVVFVLMTFSIITSWAAEDVRNSKHNLTTNANILASGTTEVCVFCHTPHGGDTTVADGAAPLWNRDLSSASYTMYKSPNFDTTFATDAQPQGVSVACLSCHDGTVAFDALLNFPLSGSNNNISFTAGNNVTAEGLMKNNSGLHSGEFPMLGTNLSNDHPISMEIPCADDPQFKEICDNLSVAPNDNQGTTQVKYLFRGAANTLPTDIRDRIRAYPTGGGGTYYVECASCHNPHENTSDRFLRYPSFVNTSDETAVEAKGINLDTDRNAGSLLCLSCHQK